MPQSQLDVTADRSERTLCLSLAGELDRATRDRFEEAVEGALSAPTAELVLDLGDVSHLDLGGINALIGAHHRTRERGATLTVLRASHTVRRIFALTRIGELLAPGRASASDPPASSARRWLR